MLSFPDLMDFLNSINYNLVKKSTSVLDNIELLTNNFWNNHYIKKL